MQTRGSKFRPLLTRIAWIASGLACAASIAFSVISIPTTIRSANAVVASAELAPVTSLRSEVLNDGNADLAILLDWHVSASNAYRPDLAGISCAPRIAQVPSVVIEASLAVQAPTVVR